MLKMNAFRMSLVVSASVVAIGAATQAFAGDGNKVYIAQSYPGTGNSFNATQDGNYNLVGAQHGNPASTVYHFKQGGSSNTADIYQQGNSNKIGYNASGSPEAAFYPGVPSGTTTPFGQFGTGNTLAAQQDGNSNRLGIFTQQGAANIADFAQVGDGNQVESLTQKGVGSTSGTPTGGNNYAGIWLLGNNNGGAGTTTPSYVGTLTGTHSVQAVDPLGGYTTHTVTGLGVTGVQLNGLANLDQLGAFNYAMVGFQGDNNRFNLSQTSDNGATDKTEANIFLAGKNGKELYDGTSTTPEAINGSGNYVYGYQNGSGNVFTLNTHGASVNGAVVLVSQSGEPGVGSAGNGNQIFWTTRTNAYYEGIQRGNGNTVTGGQGWCSSSCAPHTVKTYQIGDGNWIKAEAGNGTTGGTIDIYQEGTSNWFSASQVGPSSSITGTQIGMLNIADVRQGTGGGTGNVVNILQH